jgi:shikimate dehydrogenase
MSQTSYLLGLVGQDISASLTPAMQEQEGAAAGLRLSYRIIDAARLGLGADDLPALLDWAERLGFDGLNIDWSGYGRAFRAALPDAVQDRAVLVGAGGAGVAVGYGLLDQGAEHVAVMDADVDRAEACVVRLAKRYGDDRVSVATDLGRALDDAQGLVNATPLGMLGHPGMAVPAPLVRSDLWVSDVVYFPLETELMHLARSRGCRVIPGGGMAVQQAVGAFEYFTGRVPDADRMLGHFEELTA